MSDEIREYLQAAQAAEIRGDNAEAASLLQRVASMYRSVGRYSRALQMLRHARRLSGARAGIDLEIERLEWMSDASLADAVREEGDVQQALAPLETLEGTPPPLEKPLIERGPTRADAGAQAWCSFCCRPRTEVGALVAGPAGAFICLPCVREGARLLGDARAQPAPPPPASSDVAGLDLVGQGEARAIVEAAFLRGAPWIAVIGPEGSGKTTYLRGLARQGLGFYVPDPRALASAPLNTRLLLDGLERLSVEQIAEAVSPLERASGHHVLVALRGEEVSTSLTLKSEERELPVFSSAGLLEATGGKLPPWIADQVHAVASFRCNEEELMEVGRRLAAPRAGELTLGEDVLAAMVRVALHSARGGHELAALIARLPAGRWSLKGGGGPPRRKRRARKGEGPET